MEIEADPRSDGRGPGVGFRIWGVPGIVQSGKGPGSAEIFSVFAGWKSGRLGRVRGTGYSRCFWVFGKDPS